MKFWKFEYTSPEQVINCIENRCLPPILEQNGRLECTDAHPRRSMKVGDGVLLATLIGDQGKIFAAGIVRARPTESDPYCEVDWANAKKTVYPEPSGLEHWRSKTAFEISPEPAKRYGLKKFVEFYVRND